MKVSLISTVKDAGRDHIEAFVASVNAQTRRPDEVVIVDGGSTDGTWEALQATPGITALREPGANISRGRNVAIQAAAHDVVAVTDADCVLDPAWLDLLLEPIERGADVSAGFYRPLGGSFLQVLAAAVSLPEPEELRPGWMPSSRSIAFRRGAWEAAGGYPEWLEVGEDMFFDHQLVRTGQRFELASDAVAYWRVRPTLPSTWMQYARYAEGDALAGMYPERHALRFGTYLFLGAAAATRNRWLLIGAAAGAAAYARRPVRRAWGRLRDRSTTRVAAAAAIPAMMAFVDAAKMWGYVRGLARRLHGGVPLTS